MDQSTLFANRGSTVSIEAINEDLIDEMSLGELAYARALFGQKFSERLADPQSMHEIATFAQASGEDWSGFKPGDESSPGAGQDAPPDDDQISPPPEPVAPDNYVDTVPAMMALMGIADRTNDAALANLVRKLEVAVGHQSAYLGVPDGLKGFRDVKAILRQSMRMSGHKAKKLQIRAAYATHSSATDRTPAGAAPKLPRMASSFSAGKVPGENLDRIIHADEELTKYSRTVGQTAEYKEAVFGLFEPTMVEAAESVTPEELSQAKHRWVERIAHHIDQDGPPVSKTLKKQPDNALYLRSHDDGSATASMHMDPIWTAFFKEFVNTNLNYKGNRPLLPENIENLYAAMAEANAAQPHDAGSEGAAADVQNPQAAADSAATDTVPDRETGRNATPQHDNAPEWDDPPDSLPDWKPALAGPDEQVPEQQPRTRQQQLDDFHAILGTKPEIDNRPANQIEAELPQPVGPDSVIAEDDQGSAYTRQQVDWIDALTRAQRAGAILLGALYSVMSMHPDEAAAKRAHGSPAKLVIVQDIQTAYETLGLPQLPEAVRRPDGPDGLLPTIVKRPNPDDPEPTGTAVPGDEAFSGYANPVAWTQYQSEVINVGPLHPDYAAPTLCDVELVGQIWNGQDTVLNEYRAKRLFTTAQRKAIFARDKGCQTPGCTIQATYCQCHHNIEWSNNGHTNEANAIVLCAQHHADIHDGKWTIRKVNGTTFFQPAKWLDPYQPLLRNLYWNI